MGLCVFRGLPAFQKNLPAQLPWEKEEEMAPCSLSWTPEEESHGRRKPTRAVFLPPSVGWPAALICWTERAQGLRTLMRTPESPSQLPTLFCNVKEKVGLILFLTFSNSTAGALHHVFWAKGARAGHLYPRCHRCAGQDCEPDVF